MKAVHSGLKVISSFVDAFSSQIRANSVTGKQSNQSSETPKNVSVGLGDAAGERGCGGADPSPSIPL